ncbi:hypothetical protein [Streptomyces parvulus]
MSSARFVAASAMFRRNHLVPVPEVATLADLNAMIDCWDQED